MLTSNPTEMNGTAMDKVKVCKIHPLLIAVAMPCFKQDWIYFDF